MDEFFKSVTTGLFWISVVVVGLLINVASNYVQRAVDRTGTVVPAWLRARSAKAKASHEMRVKMISSHHEIRLLAMAYENRYRLKAYGFFGICGGMTMAIFELQRLLGPQAHTAARTMRDTMGIGIIWIGMILALLGFVVGLAYSNEAERWERACRDSFRVRADEDANVPLPR